MTSTNPSTLGRDTREPTYFVDIKSEQLRDALNTLLTDIGVINVMEDTLSVSYPLYRKNRSLSRCQVERNLLYNVLDDLSHSWNDIDPVDHARKEHVGLLVDYIKSAYKATALRLESLLRSHQITYDLFWALFKPNTMVYTTCPGTHSPRCVKHESCEEMETKSGSRYWRIEGRYLDFDGTDFGEMLIELRVPKFRGVRQISDLPAFPIQYHPDVTEVKADLFECGTKFIGLMGTHHRYCKGQAFFMHKGNPIRLPVEGRIVVDANLFRKMNPNYSQRKTSEEEVSSISSFGLLHHAQPQPERIKSTGLEPTKLSEDDLLVCCPTVPGFSFNNKAWSEIYSLYQLSSN